MTNQMVRLCGTGVAQTPLYAFPSDFTFPPQFSSPLPLILRLDSGLVTKQEAFLERTPFRERSAPMMMQQGNRGRHSLPPGRISHHALYKTSAKDAASSPTIFGPTVLDYPKPYKATIVPFSPALEDFASF